MDWSREDGMEKVCLECLYLLCTQGFEPLVETDQWEVFEYFILDARDAWIRILVATHFGLRARF